MALRNRFVLTWCALLCGATLTASASAQQDPAAARALFSEGRRLLKAGNYAQACPKFEESLKLDHGMGTQFNLAHCWEKLGRTASAWSMFLDVAAAARASGQSEREAAARQRATSLEEKLTRLKIEVPQAVPGTVVSRDETELGKASWGTATPVDPGVHRVHASAPGYLDWDKEIQVPSDGSTVAVLVPELEPAPQQVRPVADPEPAPVEPTSIMRDGGSEPGSAQRVAGIVIGSAGVVGMAVGTVFFVQGRQANSQALEMCRTPYVDETGTPGERCRDELEYDAHSDKVQEAKDKQLIGTIGLAAGGAALATGALLYFFAGPSDDIASVNVGPMWMGGGNFGAQLTGSF